MGDLIDKLLAIGATPDWISPTVAIIQDITNGPRHDFYIDLYAGWSVKEIKRLLKRHKIDVWGDMISDDMIIFSVRKVQAKQTQLVLIKNQIPIVAGVIPTR